MNTTKQQKIKKEGIPKIRFTNFSDSLRSGSLAKFGHFYYGKSAPKFSVNDNAKTPCIRYGELYSTYNEQVNNIKSFTDIDPGKLRFSKGGEVLIPRVGEDPLDFIKCTYLTIPNVAIGEMISVYNTNEDGLFITYYIRSKLKKEFARVVEGANVSNLYFRYLEKITITIPSKPEQKKVASFLDFTDQWLNNLHEQKEYLFEYKKGMMQKIFAQEIRFKDDNGKSFPKWEEKKLGEILKERKDYSVKEKGYPHISLTTQGVVPKSERYNRDFLVGDDEIKKYKITHLNDLCYNPANLKFGVISINKLGAGIFSPIYVTFEIIGQNIDFVGYYLIRNEFINKARRYEQGTVYERMAVSPADFVKVKVAFPSLPEQQKIADFLASLDKAIEAKQQQITLAENWKKGLMQGLFI